MSRDAPRPATILRVADALEAQGGEVLELFREVESEEGSAVFPIHLRKGGREFFIEVETGRWSRQVEQSVLRRVSILRSSAVGGRDTSVLVLSSYPIPEVVCALVGTDPRTLVQLDLYLPTSRDPEGLSEEFRRAAGRALGTRIETSPEYLPLVEEFVLGPSGEPFPQFLDGSALALGAYLGETIRRAVESSERFEGFTVRWERSGESGSQEVLVVSGGAADGTFELDPMGKVRAFLENGERDSLAFYAGYVLDALREEAARDAQE